MKDDLILQFLEDYNIADNIAYNRLLTIVRKVKLHHVSPKTKKVVEYYRKGLSYEEICKLMDFKTKADVTYHLEIGGVL